MRAHHAPLREGGHRGRHGRHGRQGHHARHARSRGVALLALLLTMMLGGIALMVAVDVWALARQREREQELLFVGDQYRQAIQRYYFAAPPGTARVLPARLEDLLEDNRYPVPMRHLRRPYPDPITGSSEWGIVRLGDRISGLHSLSEATPLKQAGFEPGYQQFTARASYREWVFAVSNTGRSLGFYAPASPASPNPAPGPSPGSPPPFDLQRPVHGHPP